MSLLENRKSVISVLGSTGSVGEQALDVADKLGQNGEKLLNVDEAERQNELAQFGLCAS